MEFLLTSSTESLNQSIGHYKIMLRKIFDSPAGQLQQTRGANGSASVTLNSNYLCLQCPVVVTDEERIKHGEKKHHRFCTPFAFPTPYPPCSLFPLAVKVKKVVTRSC